MEGLRGVLDELLVHPKRRSEIEASLPYRLGPLDWLFLGAWDAAATIVPGTGHFELSAPQGFTVWDRFGKQVLVGSVGGSEGHACITYGHGRDPVRVSDSTVLLPETPAVHDPVQIVRCLEVVRDRMDSLLLKPPELRLEDLSRLAMSLGIEVDRLRALDHWLGRHRAELFSGPTADLG